MRLSLSARERVPVALTLAHNPSGCIHPNDINPKKLRGLFARKASHAFLCRGESGFTNSNIVQLLPPGR